MVTRKPTAPSPISTNQPSATTSNGAPPYPTTPPAESAKTASSIYSNDLNTSPAFDLIDMNEARQRSRRDSDVSSHGTWDSDGTEQDEDTPDDEVERPKPLNVKPSQQNLQKGGERKETEGELPASLRPGPVSGAVVGMKAQENRQYDDEAHSNPWQLESNNPYLQKAQPSSGQPAGYGASSQKIWEQPLAKIPSAPPPQPARAPPPPPQGAPPAPPVELPTVRSPTDDLARMSLSDGKSAASWETAEVLPVPQKGQYPLPPVTDTPSAEAQAFPSSNPWSDPQEVPVPVLPAKEALSPVAPPQPAPQSEYAPPPGPPPGPPSQHSEPIYAPPPGPPPTSAGPLIDHAEAVRQQPPPISTQTHTAQTHEIPETPGTRDRRQRSEHYQIKHVRWFDSASGKAGMRQSPILTQNLNGPCPLLALVNALVLTTPPELDTALIETLRTREQVSLGLLLDAVFDELMSGRRGDTAQALPDVADLYSFLLALHTGMNVNPRFVTPATTPRGSFDGHPAALQGMHPAQRSQHKPGCFEETREMRLYSTFNIPLIHGWTAPNDTPAYAAFNRSAQSFEDAQNIQFAEVELEDKLQAEGLNFQEQQLLEDIQTIKSFLQTWPTQLTDYGLETISTSLKPGQIAILFRNDHFSTLYKEPRHGALMTLVTDAGYSSHDEIVWESLVDVNGAASEMFSGDFRVVSHGQDARLNQSSSGGGSEGWETVHSRSRYRRPQSSQPGASTSTSGRDEAPPPLPGPRPTSRHNDVEDMMIPQTEEQRKASEQEDHDLALALQLQEEEEDQQRQADARRRREQELSEQLLANEEQPPAMPPRRTAGGRNARASNTNIPVTSPPSGRRANPPQARPAVNRPADASDPDAPPSYEQSASDRPFRPAGATAPPTQGNPLTPLDALRHQSAYAQQSSTSVNTLPGGAQHGRRRSDGTRLQRRQSQIAAGTGGPAAPPYTPPGGRVQQAATVKDTEERCVVM